MCLFVFNVEIDANLGMYSCKKNMVITEKTFEEKYFHFDCVIHVATLPIALSNLL